MDNMRSKLLVVKVYINCSYKNSLYFDDEGILNIPLRNFLFIIPSEIEKTT